MNKHSNSFIIALFILLFFCFIKPALCDNLNQKVLEGAKKEVTNKTKYNTKMLKTYYPPTYLNGKKYDISIYPNGDVNPIQGVCSDLVVRAYRNAGVDLQKLVHEDIVKNKTYYGVKQPDKYIDHRRVWLLLRYFNRNYKKLSVKTDKKNKHWLPGDIVIWDTGSKAHLHIGIISDKRSRLTGRPLVIHNMRYVPFFLPGKTAEQDVLTGITKMGIRIKKWKILGHFRISEMQKVNQ